MKLFKLHLVYQQPLNLFFSPEKMAESSKLPSKKTEKKSKAKITKTLAAPADASTEPSPSKGLKRKKSAKSAAPEPAAEAEPSLIEDAPKPAKKSKKAKVDAVPEPAEAEPSLLEDAPKPAKKSKQAKVDAAPEPAPIEVAKPSKKSKKSKPVAPSPEPEPAPVEDAEDSEDAPLLHGFSTDDDDSSDDDDGYMDVEVSAFDIAKLPTIARDDATVKRKLENAKRQPVCVSCRPLLISADTVSPDG
jgi:nucleolar protein 15